MNKNIYIGKRYLKGKKNFLAGAHWLSLIGIVIGVCSLLIILTVMNGMQQVQIDRILAITPEIEIEIDESTDITEVTNKLQSIDFITNITPISTKTLIILLDGKSHVMQVNGVDNNNIYKQNPLFKLVPQSFFSHETGIIALLNHDKPFTNKGIYLGKTFCLDNDISLGQQITLISLNKTKISAIGKQPLTHTFIVEGVYNTPIPDIELVNAYVPASKLVKFSNKNLLYNKLNLMTDNHDKSQKYTDLLKKEFPELKISCWSDKNVNLYQAMKLEKIVMTFFLSLIIMLSSFNLSGSFLKKVSNQKKELGILATIGYSKNDLEKIFFYQGTLLGISGVVIGNIIASILLFLQVHYQIVPIPEAAISIFSSIPIKVEYLDFILVSLFSILFSMISSYLPMLRVRKLNPLELIND